MRQPAAGPPPLILVSFDGFRWDFMDRVATPALDRLAAAGVRAERLIPSFPTKTFPNHFTIVDRSVHRAPRHRLQQHPRPGARGPLLAAATAARCRTRAGGTASRSGVTAQRQGRTAAPFFWPGSEAPIGGRHAAHWQTYDGSVPHEERVDRVLALLDLPPAERPAFATVYFSDVDDAAHRYGPEDLEQVDAAVRRVDAALGRLIDGLEARGLWGRVHLLVVSDHGMIGTPPDQLIVLDDYVDLEMRQRRSTGRRPWRSGRSRSTSTRSIAACPAPIPT